MSTLQVANVHFDSTGANRIEYTGNNVVRVQGKGLVIPRIDTANTPSPEPGMMFYNTSTNNMVMMSNTSAVVTIPSNTVVDAAFASINAGYTVANAGFGKANAALANASGTFAGTLLVTGNVGIGYSNSSYVLSLSRNMLIGSQGGGDTTIIGGGSGIGSFTSWNYADGTINAQILGNGDSYVNKSYGSFGIGTGTPQAKLHTVQTGQTWTAYFVNTNAAWATDFGIEYAPSGGSVQGALGFSARSGGDVWIKSANTQGNMLFMTSGANERMRIDPSGRITKPNQPCFSVSYSGAGYVASEGDSNTWDAVLWNTATGSGRFNNGNHYNGATGCFTAPVTGKYMFMTQIHHHAGGGTCSGYSYMDLAFGTTGSQSAIAGASSYHRCIFYLTTDTWWEMPPQVTILNLAANDSVFVRVVNTAGATFLGASRPDHNRWSCWFLG